RDAGSARTPPNPADVDENSGRSQRNHLARATIRHEWQREPRGGHEIERDSHVHKGGEPDRCGQARREILAERLSGGFCDSEPEPAEQCEGGDHETEANEAPFLTDPGEEKNRIRIWEGSHIFCCRPQSRTKPNSPDR